MCTKKSPLLQQNMELTVERKYLFFRRVFLPCAQRISQFSTESGENKYNHIRRPSLWVEHTIIVCVFWNWLATPLLWYLEKLLPSFQCENCPSAQQSRLCEVDLQKKYCEHVYSFAGKRGLEKSVLWFSHEKVTCENIGWCIYPTSQPPALLAFKNKVKTLNQI